MIIDSLTDKREIIDISALSVPEPVKEEEAGFDPKKDLLSADWPLAESDLSILREKVVIGTADVCYWASFAQCLVTLAPERKSSFEIDEELGRKLFNRMSVSSTETSGWADFLEAGSALRILYPDLFDYWQFDEGWFKRVLQEISEYRSRFTSYETAQKMIEAIEIFPQRRNEILSTDRQLADVLTMVSERELATKDWQGFISYMAVLKILFPGREPQISPSDWISLRKFFHNNTDQFGPKMRMKLALWMYVLAAEEVGIGENDLTINLRRPLSPIMAEEVPPMPERRIF